MPILEDGQRFERYRIIRWLGSGVAGESYEAEDRTLLRKVTLKLIHPWVTLPDSARRQFFREIQGISTLNNPYLASVLDYGEVDGRLYLARRFVSSGSLLGTNGRNWFRPPLSVTDAFTYAHQLAQALHYIHQHGYIHGALTFSNVLVLRGPNLENEADYAPFLLADVGLSHFVRRFGNPQISTLPISAAPEQLGKRVTPASDQFALAVLVYFWLAGRPPYLGSPDEVEQMKLSEKITPLSTLNPGVSFDQDGIILRALTVYPEERHSSVLAFTEALMDSLLYSPRVPQPAINPSPAQPETPRDPQPASWDTSLIPNNVNTSLEPAEQEPTVVQDSTLEESTPPILETLQPAISNVQEPLTVAYSDISQSTIDVETLPQETPSVHSQASQAEQYQSALDILLSLPWTASGDLPALSKILPVDEQLPEEPVMLTIPETPQVEEFEEETVIVHEILPTTQAEVVNEQIPLTPDESDNEVAQFTRDEVVEVKVGNTMVYAQFAQNESPASFAFVEEEFPQENEKLEVSPTEPGEPAGLTALETLLTFTGESSPVKQTQPLPPVELSPANQTETPVSDIFMPTEPALMTLSEIATSAIVLESNANQDEELEASEIETDQTNEEELEASEIEADQTNELDASNDQREEPDTQEDELQALEDYLPATQEALSPRLIVTSPFTNSPYEFLLLNAETNLGRAGASDLLLDHDNLTSRHHALIKRIGEHILIFDKRSHNGVYINGQKIEAERGYELADGDHISIGNYELIFRYVPENVISQLI